MKRLLAGLLLACGAAQAAQIESAQLGARHYLLARPAQAAARLRPLVIVLHGHAGSAAQVLGRARVASPLSVWLDIADREQLLVIAPDGLKGSDGQQGWNDCRGDAHTNPKGDDTAFIGALIDKAVAQDGADPARVYVIGMSNGGMMSFRLAADLGPRIAAFGAISASMAARSSCAAPATPLPALIVSGTADPLVPFGGGQVHFFALHERGSVLPVEDSVAVWRSLDKLVGPPSQITLPHRLATDKTSATRIIWGADPHQLQVEFLRIDGGGHVEPSIAHRVQRLLTAMLGAQNADVEIAEEAWTFFKDKRRTTP